MWMFSEKLVVQVSIIMKKLCWKRYRINLDIWSSTRYQNIITNQMYVDLCYLDPRDCKEMICDSDSACLNQNLTSSIASTRGNTADMLSLGKHNCTTWYPNHFVLESTYFLIFVDSFQFLLNLAISAAGITSEDTMMSSDENIQVHLQEASHVLPTPPKQPRQSRKRRSEQIKGI